MSLRERLCSAGYAVSFENKQVAGEERAESSEVGRQGRSHDDIRDIMDSGEAGISLAWDLSGKRHGTKRLLAWLAKGGNERK